MYMVQASGMTNIYAKFQGKSIRHERLKEHDQSKDHKKVVQVMMDGGAPEDLKPKIQPTIFSSFQKQEDQKKMKVINQIKLAHQILKKGSPISQFEEDNKFIRQVLGFSGLSSTYENMVACWEFVEAIDGELFEHLKQKINKSDFFGVQIDESTDEGCHEQLAICVQYLDEDFETNEDFVQNFNWITKKFI
eukprot:TRINITY_DN108_c0_g1_i4.p2 TRINITY_DN108_c0_g1~~TRINITY_DN108_c0_g1_i4.p2  ORF type:complete len:191 (+),score=25.32 TRINITY_DN108_c0_g1_i4:613-1185(+)